MLLHRMDRKACLWGIVCVLSFLAMSSGPLYAQNLVSNASVEQGTAGGLPEGWSAQKEGGAEGRVSLTDEDAHSGERCLRIEHTNEIGYIHPNKGVEVEAGDYLFRFWAKSDRSLWFVAQIYRTVDWTLPLDETCSLEPGEWTKFEFHVSFLEPIPGSIQIGLTDPGKLWLDDVSLIRQDGSEARGGVSLWDTQTPFREFRDEDGWLRIPPGTTPKPEGDLVLRNGYLSVVLSKTDGVVIDSKSGMKRATLVPISLKSKDAQLTSCEVVRNAKEEVSVRVRFSPGGIPWTISLGQDPILRLESAERTEGMSIRAPMDFALLPGFIGDDLIYRPEDYSSKTLYIPSEHMLMGLLRGEESVLVVTWPDENSAVNLIREDQQTFGAIALQTAGGPIYVALLEAPGIWHREVLHRTYLEKDVVINWRRPFPAKWVTQLYEDGIKTRYAFRESKPETRGFWRAAIGYYTYPVWFQEDQAVYHLGKRIPPKGDSIIYCIERKGTPISILTPIDVLRRTLGHDLYERIVDIEGRRNRSLQRSDCAIGAATCGVTDQLKLIFEAGQEVEQRSLVEGGVEDMIYFLARERERALEYRIFAHEMLEFLDQAEDERPGQKPFLDEIKGIAGALITEYEHEKANIKDVAYTWQLAQETETLAERRSSQNLDTFLEIKGRWTAMGGAVDDLNRRLHTLTRKLFQQAGYRCAERREWIPVAQQIREKVIQCLRNPGSYEIWSEY